MTSELTQSHRSELNRRPLVMRSWLQICKDAHDAGLKALRASRAPKQRPKSAPRSVPQVSGYSPDRGTCVVALQAPSTLLPERHAGRAKCADLRGVYGAARSGGGGLAESSALLRSVQPTHSFGVSHGLAHGLSRRFAVVLMLALGACTMDRESRRLTVVTESGDTLVNRVMWMCSIDGGSISYVPPEGGAHQYMHPPLNSIATCTNEPPRAEAKP